MRSGDTKVPVTGLTFYCLKTIDEEDWCLIAFPFFILYFKCLSVDVQLYCLGMANLFVVLWFIMASCLSKRFNYVLARRHK